jgi:hypothetical protein
MLIQDFDLHILSIACDDLHDYKEKLVENFNLEQMMRMIRQQGSTWAKSQRYIKNTYNLYMVMPFSHLTTVIILMQQLWKCHPMNHSIRLRKCREMMKMLVTLNMMTKLRKCRGIV